MEVMILAPEREADPRLEMEEVPGREAEDEVHRESGDVRASQDDGLQLDLEPTGRKDVVVVVVDQDLALRQARGDLMLRPQDPSLLQSDVLDQRGAGDGSVVRSR